MKEDFFNKGYFIKEKMLDANSINKINKNINSSLEGTIIYETKSNLIRSIMSYHSHNDVLKRYTCYEPIYDIVSQLIGKDLYISQSKINLKKPNGLGRKWDFHRGFTFWHMLDGKPRQEMISVLIFLTKQTIENGAVYILEESHKYFDLKQMNEESFVETDLRENDTSEVLSIQIKPSYIDKYKRQFKKKYLTGEPGDVIFMHPSLLHASDTNNSDKSRDLMITVFNSLKNLPTNKIRPSYLCERDFTPIQPIK